MERSEINAKYKWDLSAIYPTEEAFLADYAECEAMAEAFAKHEPTMTNGPEELCEALSDSAKLEYKLEKLWTYAFLTFAVDTSNNESQARTARVRSLVVKAENATWFVSPYLLKLEKETVDGWLNEYEPLRHYERGIHLTMREKPHTLSDECEKLMAKLGDSVGSHSDIRNIFANSDLHFGKIRNEEGKLVELSDTSYVPFLMSKNRNVRRAAFTTLYKTYEQFGNTFATVYNAYVKERVTHSKARSYESSIEASTFRDEVTPVIYNNLIDSVNEALPTLYKYYALKKKLLGVGSLHLYDIYAPTVGAFDKKYTYEEAVDEVLTTVKVFGDEYYNTLRAGLTERGWCDVYPSKGKRGGAFSAGCPATEPYIMLNFNEKYNDVSTLAHEAGHSMHSYFSRKYNEPQNSSYTIFVAEVASTVNELLMAHRKLRECSSDDEKLYILDKLMDTYKGTLFRQTMFAEFERDAHAACERGTPLTADTLNTMYKGLVDKYFGKGVVCDRQIAFEWMRIPHFYTNFYVYKYATYISAASAIVKRIENEGEEYVGKYIEFLKCGGSKSPLESLMVAGIDMRDPEVVKGAIEDFASSIAEFNELYDKKSK